MKKIIIGIFCLFAGISYAQKPETVYSVVKEQREISWYLLQQKLWKAEIDKDRKNANAWYNYYSATRALRNSWYDDKDPQEAAKKRQQYTDQGNEIAAEAYKAVPASFEANHIKWWNGGNEAVNLPFLLKAYEINPNDPRTYDDLMIHYEIVRDKQEFHNFSNKLYEVNDLPANLLNWGYNLLSELDQNAIVFTVGDNDTYAGWVVQEAKNYRKDVKVINTSLILKDDYRNKLFRELKLPPLDVSLHDSLTAEGLVQQQKKVFDHILKNTSGIPVYVSVSGISTFEADYADHLFLTGLAYKYAPQAFDNISIIRRNYEKRYLLDYLKMSFAFHMSNSHAENFNGMYLPSMLKLYKHYKESEETSKMKTLEEMILRISERTGQKDEVYELLK